MEKIKKVLGHRSLSPVSPLLCAALVTAVMGFVFTPIVCIMLSFWWMKVNGVFKHV